MKAYVNRDTCICCGVCEGICPDVFELDDEGKSVPVDGEIPEDVLSMAHDAETSCPVDAISVE